MSLLSLDIRDFRNIQTARLKFSEGLNLITGSNAAGKTSLLEAIYCLGRVRSFRTANVAEPVQYGKHAYQLVGHVRQSSGRTIAVGIERQSSGLRVHMNGRAINRLSELAGSFPVQVISSETDNIIEGGPGNRRQVIDWGLFHVEHGYRDHWSRYMRALKQRNAALRAKLSAPQVQVWDPELLLAGMHIHQLRADYFASLQPGLEAVMHELLPGLSVILHYQRGWPLDVELEETLKGSVERDRNRGFTLHGIHRADFSIEVDGRDARAHCSRGQQKALAVGFMLAQLGLQRDRDVALGAFLLDDFASELDEAHQARVLLALRQMQAQVFVTAIEGNTTANLGWETMSRFHVEHGKILEVI